MKTATTLLAVAAIAILSAASIASMLFPPQDAYAPATRRGYFCEFRPAEQLNAAYPIQAEIMAQTIAQNNGIGLLYQHS